MVQTGFSFDGLSPALGARTRFLGGGNARGRYVVYWMRTALRADENPALDVALGLARKLGVPAFVYQGLSERTPHAAARHHHFLLEGARDVAAQLAAKGIGYALHVERPSARGSVLHQLAQDAAAVVTEDFPLDPLRTWAERLAARAPCPVLAVDTACVLPMQRVGRPYDRAFAFRRATERARAEVLLQPPAPVEPHLPAFLPELPFAPVEVARVDLGALIASCAIDHSVPRVPETPGGTTAGLARWDAFRARGLRAYARDRNDPLLRGTSRLSPYLHAGMISPVRLAREAWAAQQQGAPGAEKFLDELLIWRELAHCFCFHVRGAATVAAVPSWARDTLRAHEGDARTLIPLPQLAAAASGDALWDACQRSLLRHGELHNNLRMTWGKALLSWTRDAGEALAFLLHLNDRYALDGRDPSSLGGILWCLGQFDRPFPDTRVLGSVRARPLAGHAARLDVAAFTALVDG